MTGGGGTDATLYNWAGLRRGTDATGGAVRRLRGNDAFGSSIVMAGADARRPTLGD